MKFWKDNKISDEFDMTVSDVAGKFTEWYASDPDQDFNLERTLRWWLTSPEHFSSVWVAETGDESFEELLKIVLDRIYGPLPRLTRGEQEIEARKRVCPRCHAEAGKPCRRPMPRAIVTPYGKPMKGIHAERRDLVSRFRNNEQDSTS